MTYHNVVHYGMMHCNTQRHNVTSSYVILSLPPRRIAGEPPDLLEAAIPAQTWIPCVQYMHMMHMCIHTYKCIYIYIYIHMCIHIYTYIYIYICVCVYIYTHIVLYLCIYAHIYINISLSLSIYIYICICIYIYIYIYIPAYIHTRIHTSLGIIRYNWNGTEKISTALRKDDTHTSKHVNKF